MNTNNYEIVVDRLTKLIATTARMDPQGIDRYENLIELGADSIILTDVNSYIKEEFHVEIPLTLFFEQLTSVADISDYILPRLQSDYFIQIEQSTDALQKIAIENNVLDKATEDVKHNEHLVNHSEAPTNVPINVPVNIQIDDASVASLFSQQLEIMNNQLKFLSGNHVAATTMTPNTGTMKLPEQGQKIENKTSYKEPHVVEINQDHSNSSYKPYIPHKRIELEKKRSNEKQTEHIQDLIERYTAKTKLSKEFAAKYRLPYADWRNISGFRPAIKEMVYQLVFQDSKGSHITDIDGNTYIDLTMDFGVSLFGHNANFIKEAITNELTKGFPLSLITDLSGEVAELICEFTGTERVSFFNSGTEAVMVALRVARAATGKNKVVIFAGAYHGTFDGVLGMHPMNKAKEVVTPIAGGIPQGLVDDIYILDYDDPESLVFISEHADELAAVLVEPVQSRRPDLQPRAFLHELRNLTENKGIKLIFDEMILGFRLGKGGAQEFFGVKADLVTYGKIVGGGMPIGIVAGTKEVMNCIDGGVWNYGDDSTPPDEERRTFAGGTFCHHPLTMAAAKAVLHKIKAESDTIYPVINARTKFLADTLNAFFIENQAPIEIVYCGSLFRFILRGNMEMFYYHLLDKGVYIWEGRNSFLSVSHTDEDLEKIINAVKETCLQMKSVFFLVDEKIDRYSVKAHKTLELTLEQQKMLASEMVNQGTSAFNQPILISIEGHIDYSCVNAALEIVVARHEALRYTITSDMSKFCINSNVTNPVVVIKTDIDSESNVISELVNTRFDYINGPLFKVYVLEPNNISNGSVRMLIIAHHLIADGWSVSLLFEELIEAYNSLKTGDTPRFNEVVSFSEYLDLNEIALKGLDKTEFSNFWREYLSDCDHEIHLPQRNLMSVADTGKNKGERLTYTTDDSFIKKVRKLAATAKCSPFIVFLSVYQIMLNQISEQKNFAIAVPVAGQQAIAPKSLIGNCNSILPIVAQLNDDSTIINLAKSNLKTFREFDVIKNFPMDSLSMEIEISHPQMNIMFNMDRMPQSKEFIETTIEILPLDLENVKYDLFFNIIDFKGEIVFDIDFNSELYSRESVSRWLQLYLSIMEQLCDDPIRPLYDLNVFSQEDETTTISVVNNINLGQLERQLSIHVSDYGILNDEFCCSILNKEGKPVITNNYGQLYLGKNRIEIYNTGWLARITNEAQLEMVGHQEQCFLKDGRLFSTWLIEEKLNQCPLLSEAEVIYDAVNHNIVANVQFITEDKYVNNLLDWCHLNIPLGMIPEKFYSNVQNGQSETEKILLEYKHADMTDTEATVFEIVSRLIDSDHFSKDDGVFSLGLNSLKVLKMISEIQVRYDGIRIPISKLGQSLSVSSIAIIIDELLINSQKSQIITIPKIEEKPYYETSSSQKRMYVLHEFNPDSLNYNLPSVIKITGKFDIDKFNNALNTIVNRHENLRANFAQIDGEIVQIIKGITEINNIQIEYIESLDEINEEQCIETLRKDFIRPFDLKNDSLMRARVIKVSSDNFILFLDFHHIIFDGASALILAKEIMAIYNDIALLPLKCQYKDFVVWQNELLRSEEIRIQESYWKDVFSSEAPESGIATDFVRPLSRSYAGNILKYDINADVKQMISKRCRENECTQYTFFISALNVLLSMYSRQTDIVVGTLVEGRNHHNLQDLIGMFVNTVPIRNSLDQQQRFNDFLKTVQNNTMMAFSNSEVQLERIIELSGIKSEVNRNPLFDIMFSYQDFDYLKLESTDVTFEYQELLTDDCKFDIEFEIVDRGDNYTLMVEYATELFKEETIDRMVGHFITLLHSILLDPAQKCYELDMVTAEEKEQLLVEFNDTKVEYEHEKTILDLFEEWAHKSPTKTAIRYEEQDVMYEELNSRANQIAKFLLNNRISEEDVVGIMLERTPDMIRSIMGIWKAGGAYLPLDVDHPIQRRLDILQEANVKYILTLSRHVTEEFKNGYHGEIICLDQIEKQLDAINQDDLKKSIKPSGLAYILFTSGSTGKPKGVMIEHAGMLNHILAERDMLGLDHRFVFAQNANHCFDISVWQMVGALALGGTTVIYSNELVLEPKRFVDSIAKDRVTLLEVVPSYMSVMMDYIEDSGIRLPELKYLMITGEMVKPYLLRQWFNICAEIPVINAYGPAEASDDICQHVIRSMPETMVNVPIGKPLNNVSIYILDSVSRLCPVGVVGELCVAGVSVGRGYVNDELRTKRAFFEDPFVMNGDKEFSGVQRMYRTGDLARWLPDGTIEYLGRMDEQVKVRGYRIELGEIESVIRKQTGV
ncbi:amino acid adenylation domain-containing protein, partial [Fontibacillus panacisegetis]